MADEIVIAVGVQDAGARLDSLVARAAGLSRARAAGLIASGGVTVDGRAETKAYRVSAGEEVRAAGAERPAADDTGPEPRIVYEDEHLLVVDKPAGVVVHPAAGVRSGTLVQGLIRSGRPLAPRAGNDRPGIVHRLDRYVSGLLVVAKTDEAHARLARDLVARRITREYMAAVAGVPGADSGKIEAPVGRHPRHRTRMAVLAEGRPAVSWFRVRERLASGAAALLEVRLETGRTHQIRTHLESIGHPILGDAAYGGGRARELAADAGLRRPFLHAFRLTLDHPATGERLRLESDLPYELALALERLRA